MLIIVAVIVAVSGGFRTTVGGFRISARSPFAAAVAALVAGAAWLAMARRQQSAAADLEGAWRAIERHSTRLIGALALVAAIVAATFATRSAAGADASGYLSEAAMLANGELYHRVRMFPYSEHTWITAPLGWIPRGSDVQSPSYPPGLPMLMAIPHRLAGLDGAQVVVIASAALAVWATGMIAGGTAGVVAALFLALSPVFLYQSVQPMSDVPATAAWMVCFLLVRGDKPLGLSVVAGITCALAVLIRPNLAPLAVVPLLMARRKIAFAAPVALAGIFLAALQWFWYGSPLRSGYGTAEELFSISNIVPNAGRYASWLVATSPVLFFAPLGFARVRKDPHARALIAFAVLVIVAYLVYAVFDHWSYLRFLLPALAVFAVFAAIALTTWLEQWPVAIRFPILLTLMLAVAAQGLFVARTFDTFKLKEQFRRVGQVADAINHSAPPEAVIVAGEQSGAMRYYTGRSILRWEAATPETLPAVIEVLLKAGRPIYIVLDAWETEAFQKKFPDIGPAELDWPPMLEAGSSHRTLAWNLADRWRYQLGQRINTVRIP
jgi:hypothetical protein